MADGANIDLRPINWEWVPCLTLPVMRLNALHLSRRPYKWIGYAIGIVIGAHGTLSTNQPDPAALDEWWHCSLQLEYPIFKLWITMLKKVLVISQTHVTRFSATAEHLTPLFHKLCIYFKKIKYIFVWSNQT